MTDKMHMESPYGRVLPYCDSRYPRGHLYVTNDAAKVTCKRCKRSMAKATKFNLRTQHPRLVVCLDCEQLTVGVPNAVGRLCCRFCGTPTRVV